MTEPHLYTILTKVEKKEEWKDPIIEALNRAIDDTGFRFNNATREETYAELLSRFSHRIDLICDCAPANTCEMQYEYIFEEVLEMIKFKIKHFTEEELDLEYIPF